MELIQPIVLILHLIGVAMGVGGAITTDATFLRSIWDRQITAGQLKLIEVISKVVISGLVLLVLSGISLLALNPHYLSLSDGSSLFWVKMTIVAILSVNGYVFHKKILPMLRRHADKNLDSPETRSKLWLLALTGGLSGISWFTVLVLGVLMQAIDFPYLFILNLYLLLVLGAVITGYVGIYWLLFSDLRKRMASGERFLAAFSGTKTVKANKAQPKKPRIPWQNNLLMGLAVVAVLATGLVLNTNNNQGQEHFVCISEAAPWFSQEVLEINQGDTVVWHHCAEGEVDYEKTASFWNIPKVNAHGDSGAEDRHSDEPIAGEHIHTHPIHSISGPEEFSSDMAPVGHLEEGEAFRHTFDKTGVYEYICPTHPYMKGIIAVGEEAPVSSLWPPDDSFSADELLSAPEIPGIGEIWLDTQFERVDGQEFPGTITVLDAATWQTKEIISDQNFNNPHNLWNTYDGKYIFQTQWHSNKVSKIDIKTKGILDTVTLGNAPAHLFVHPDPDKDRIYVTLNNESKIIVLNSDLVVVNEIETSFGPHGIWIDPGGQWMSVAATLSERLDIIDLETEKVVETFNAPGLPLATQITHDGKYAMVSLLLEGKVRFIDLETMEHVKDISVGEMPIWATPGPYGNYVYVPNSGSGDVSVISLNTLKVEKTLPAAAGAHGIAFGKKQGGGYYGYVSNKLARAISVIDVDEQETLGHIKLHKEGWGGNGILTLPNSYEKFITQ